MKKNRGCAALVLLACVTAAHAAEETPDCQYREEPSATAASPSESRLKLLSMTPAEGGDVRKTTVIGVDVEFQIAGFQPDAYFIVGMFPTGGNGAMSTGDPDSPKLKSEAGKAHVCIELDGVYANPNMRWPLTMRVMMMRMRGSRDSVSAAESRVVELNALDIPEGALEQQVKALPQEYHDALMKLFGYFSSRAARYKVCIARFPATQAKLTKGYRAWESRHRADIDLVEQAQFESFKTQVGGRAEVAAQLDEHAAAATRRFFEEMSDAMLKEQCDWAISEVSEAEDPTNDAISDELKILRKYQPAAGVESGR